MNYGEDVAYWYLRLNGFFPLTNFVLHPQEDNERQGDVDVLAVRPPFVYEQVGGQVEDFDQRLIGDPRNPTWIGVVCEVKTGQVRYDTQVFRDDHVRAATLRLGLLPDPDAESMIDALQRASTHSIRSVTVRKILIATHRWPGQHFEYLPLDHAERFIEARAHKYYDDKHHDRIYFPAGAFQSAIRMEERRRQANQRRSSRNASGRANP